MGLYDQMARRADVFATRLAFAAALNVAAGRVGVAAGDAAVRLDPNAVRHSQRGRTISAVRREAMYLTVVRYGRSQHAVARALGLTQQLVNKAVIAIEEAREDGGYDRHLDELELALMGDAA